MENALKRLFLFPFFLFILNIFQCEATEVLLEAKGGYFFPSDHRFKKIYSGGGIYGGEISVQIAHSPLYAWISGDYFSKNGRSIGEKNSTTIQLIPLAVGLKYLYPISILDLYLGAGLQPTYFRTIDRSPYVSRTVSKWGLGGMFKGGILFNIKKGFFVDVFSGYSLLNIHYHSGSDASVIRNSAHLSGWIIGAGLGYRFGKK